MTDKSLSYRDAGVDIDAGEALVKRIRPIAERTRRPEVLTGLGGFGGLFELAKDRYRQPVLVAGSDGVGTKLKLAIRSGRHRGIGVDLVAMCVNDVLVCGAEPLFFLDYYASAALDVDVAAEVIAGIGDGCQQCGAALLGGETAEMPGLYRSGDYDLAGFCVGVVDKHRLIDGRRVGAGCALLALASSGPHANGFSLIHRVLERSNAALERPLDDDDPRPLGERLLAPTRIYATALRALRDAVEPLAIAHVTGGGLTDNLPRVLPDGLRARIDLDSWRRPALFDWLQRQGNIADDEMWRTFNCGVGLVVCVAENDVDAALRALTAAGETAWRLGAVLSDNGDGSAARVVFQRGP